MSGCEKELEQFIYQKCLKSILLTTYENIAYSHSL